MSIHEEVSIHEVYVAHMLCHDILLNIDICREARDKCSGSYVDVRLG